MANSVITKTSIKPKKSPLKFNKYNRFNLTFLLAALCPMLIAGLFNYIIDPYDIFKSPYLEQFNDIKPSKDHNDRLFKAVDIIRIKPTAIIIGSSRTKQGMDPDNPIFKNQKSVYNLSINGTNVYEIKRYIQHSLANQKKLNLIVFGVDFFMFNNLLENKPSFSENRLEKTHLSSKDILNSLFSLDTLNTSWETLNESLKKNGDRNYGINGFMYHRKLDNGKREWRFKNGINQYYDFHNQYEFSQKYLNDFKEIVAICQENNIELKVFISPSHATQWEAIRITGEWENFEEWKRKLVKIVPVWDFSGYNSITTEPIKENMSNYADNSHYTPPIGDLVLNRIYNKNIDSIPSDFGVLITPKNIEQHLLNIRQNREIYVQNNPESITLVQDIHKNFLSK